MDCPNCIVVPKTTAVSPGASIPTSIMLPISKPNSVEIGVAPDEDQECLKAIVNMLMNKGGANYSYCTECAAKADKSGQPKYVPIIMIPIESSNSANCPFTVRNTLENLCAAESKKK